MLRDMSRIEIGKIDTSEARENLDKLLEENKNYFLHASWGSGKTEFLKSGKKKSRKKLVYLDLWRVKDESTVANTTFRLLYKYNAIIFKILFIICIMISILMTDIVNLGIEKNVRFWYSFECFVWCYFMCFFSSTFCCCVAIFKN